MPQIECDWFLLKCFWKSATLGESVASRQWFTLTWSHKHTARAEIRNHQVHRSQLMGCGTGWNMAYHWPQLQGEIIFQSFHTVILGIPWCEHIFRHRTSIVRQQNSMKNHQRSHTISDQRSRITRTTWHLLWTWQVHFALHQTVRSTHPIKPPKCKINVLWRPFWMIIMTPVDGCLPPICLIREISFGKQYIRTSIYKYPPWNWQLAPDHEAGPQKQTSSSGASC